MLHITKFTVYCTHPYKYIRHLFLTYSAHNQNLLISPNFRWKSLGDVKKSGKEKWWSLSFR